MLYQYCEKSLLVTHGSSRVKAMYDYNSVYIKGKKCSYILSSTPVKQNLANKDSDRVMREYALKPNMGALLVSQASGIICRLL